MRHPPRVAANSAYLQRPLRDAQFGAARAQFRDDGVEQVLAPVDDGPVSVTAVAWAVVCQGIRNELLVIASEICHRGVVAGARAAVDLLQARRRGVGFNEVVVIGDQVDRHHAREHVGVLASRGGRGRGVAQQHIKPNARFALGAHSLPAAAAPAAACAPAASAASTTCRRWQMGARVSRTDCRACRAEVDVGLQRQPRSAVGSGGGRGGRRGGARKRAGCTGFGHGMLAQGGGIGQPMACSTIPSVAAAGRTRRRRTLAAGVAVGAAAVPSSALLPPPGPRLLRPRKGPLSGGGSPDLDWHSRRGAAGAAVDRVSATS
eukprot:364189-Chlamydomonas_euryale.AAC.31